MPETRKALEGLKGVRSFEVRYLGGTRGRVSFLYMEGQTTPEELVRAVEKTNPAYRVSIGEPPKADKLDFRALSAREDFDLRPLLAPGKVTIVQFFEDGDWDSIALGMRLDNLALKYRCALRKVTLAGPGARAKLGRPVPYAAVYGPTGVAMGDGTTAGEIEAVLKGR